ncbi:hypothetical protein [Streptomyces sp. NPDC088762]|uniref:hypothetical protein n=1 Tax=Streptomyces sp. NPDC088762 TaxID=3365891 RepID=UPI0038290CB7
MREQIRAIARALDTTGEPRLEESTKRWLSTYGDGSEEFTVLVRLPVDPGPMDAVAEAFAEAGWQVERYEDRGMPRVRASSDGYLADARALDSGLLIKGTAPGVWVARWTRPERAVTPSTVRPGYEICRECDGWGTCEACEGLGFLNGRQCPMCGIGTVCADCGGSGQLPVS